MLATDDIPLAPAALTVRSGRRASIAEAVGEARPMAWLTAVEGGARVLSFGFYLIAARTFRPDGFGVVQYTITVAMLAFGGLQVLTTAVMRELGAARGSARRTQEVLGSSMAVAAGLVAATCLLCLAAQAAGVANGADPSGLMAVLAGTAALQLYYSISRGLGHPGRQAASYAGASLVQLVVFGAVVLVSRPTPTAALLTFGLTGFVPVLVYEWRSPVLRGQSLRLSRPVMGRMWVVAAPLVVAQVCYLVWNSLDQIWVQGVLGTFQVGLYAAAKNLSLALTVVAAGVNGALLPRVSELRNEGSIAAARRLIVWGTTGTLVLSALIAAVIAALRVELLGDLYGPVYRAAAGPLAVLSFGMVCYATFTSLTMASVGWGRPHVYTAGIALAAIVEALMLGLAGHRDLMSAAVAYSVAIAAALALVVLLLRIRPPWAVER